MKSYTILQATSCWLGRPATTAKQAPQPIAPRKLEPLPPPVMIQVYEILREHGFSFEEAPQRLFQLQGAVTIEISAGVARLVYAPRHYETPRRTLERLNAQQNLEIDSRAREIREKRERDERRRPW